MYHDRLPSHKEIAYMHKISSEPYRINMDLAGLCVSVKRSSLGPKMKTRCLKYVDDYKVAETITLENVTHVQHVCRLVKDDQRWASLELLKSKISEANLYKQLTGNANAQF